MTGVWLSKVQTRLAELRAERSDLPWWAFSRRRDLKVMIQFNEAMERYFKELGNV